MPVLNTPRLLARVLTVAGLVLAGRRRPRLSSELVCSRRNSFGATTSFDFAQPELDLSAVSNFSLAKLGLNGITLGNASFAAPICLDLSQNRLESWPRFVYSGWRLRYLNLSHNLLNGWDLASAAQLGSLIVLDLSYNNISSLQLSALLFLRNLQVIHLQGNPVHIFGALKQMESLRAVVLSSRNWYAVNNIDFGTHPVELFLNGSHEAALSSFLCSTRLHGVRLHLQGCSQVMLAEPVVQSEACITCFQCWSNWSPDTGIRLPDFLATQGQQSILTPLDNGTSVSLWLALGPVCALAALISLGVVCGQRRCRLPPSTLLAAHRPFKESDLSSPGSDGALGLPSPLTPLRLADRQCRLSPMMTPRAQTAQT